MNKVAKRYADWDKATKRMAQIKAKKAYRKAMFKNILKWSLYITLALILIIPIVIGCLLSSSVIDGVSGAFAQLSDDHRRIRENKKYY